MMLVTIVLLAVCFRNLLVCYSIFFRLGRMRGEGISEISKNIMKAARVFDVFSAILFVGTSLVGMIIISIQIKTLFLLLMDVCTIAVVFGKFHGFWIQNYFEAKKRISTYEEVLFLPDEMAK
ncbi:MAG: hypothetical protein Q7K11_00685 [Candidatus Berkelbacteria bacterium]|nr:hypothetical protein [Candidatus Berkelbacteria bacterium]